MSLDFNKILISIVRSALTKEKAAVPSDFDTAKLFKTSNDHHIMNIVYSGSILSGLDKKDPFVQKLFIGAGKEMIRSELQQKELSLLFDEFEKQDVEYMPLKGINLKKIYPAPEMRVMSDADVVINQNDYPRIQKLMERLGYTFECESNHEYIYRKDTLLLELHKMLIPSYNEDYYSYFGSGFAKGVKNRGSLYKMSPEDEFIFIFAHFAKHYRDGGIGIKHLIDIYVYLNHYKNIDKKYIEKELLSLGLYDFYINVLHLIDVWFENKKSSPLTDFMSEVIIESTAYGTRDKHITAQALRISKGKHRAFRMFISRLFPPLSVMKISYKSLIKFPFLVPVFWVVRIFDALINKRQRVKIQLDNIKEISENEVLGYEKTLKYVGLSFKYKE